MATVFLSITTTTWTTNTNNHITCHAFLLPQHQVILTSTRQSHLTVNQQDQYYNSNNIHRRNRFWGLSTVGADRSLSSLHHRHHRHSNDNNNYNALPVTMALLSGPSILDRPTTTKESTVKEEQQQRQQQHQRYNETWEVRLYNDGLNTREHVSRSLVQVTGLSEYQAYHTMMQAHHNGMAVVGQYYYEIAEMFHDALKLEGIICDIIPVE
jgi:ATP-dependent Clp protease adapter protein ClpS